MEDYCENCGAPVKENSKFCHECGAKIEPQKLIEEKRFCENCGSQLSPDEIFCSNCGHSQNEKQPVQTVKNDNTKIIIALIAVIAVLAVGVGLMAGGVFHQEVPLETQDFGVFTMLAPEGCNFVETSSMPSYGFGGFIYMNNAGAYSEEVGVLGISTTAGSSHPSQVSLERVDGDIKIFKDNQGHDVYYIDRQVGEYTVTLMGQDDAAMIKMLQSIELK